MYNIKLQALVYDILPSATGVFSYAIGSRKLSANEQFFVGAQTVVSLLQTTQIKQGMSFIAANKVYTSTNKTTIVWIETELFFSFLFLPGVDASHVYVRALALGCFYSHISTGTFRRALTASLDSCAEIKSASSVAYLNLAEYGGRCRKSESWSVVRTTSSGEQASVTAWISPVEVPPTRRHLGLVLLPKAIMVAI